MPCVARGSFRRKDRFADNEARRHAHTGIEAVPLSVFLSSFVLFQILLSNKKQKPSDIVNTKNIIFFISIGIESGLKMISSCFRKVKQV